MPKMILRRFSVGLPAEMLSRLDAEVAAASVAQPGIGRADLIRAAVAGWLTTRAANASNLQLVAPERPCHA
jgi:metal-responsive CopG/Arc/MetJ family transcriptional regulator